jgi:DNA primase
MKGNRADVQAIKERVDVIGLISRYVSLSPSGANYKGRCPFHKDDTPSMVVDAEKGLWHCFGCGEGGDVIAFLMKIERLSFIEAVRRLAEEVGMSFDVAEDGERAKLRAITAEAAEYFVENLAAAAGRKARDYLLERGYDAASWATYGLGYALPGWENLKRRFARYGEATLVDLGLLVRGEENTYDRFRDRTIFPIHDLSGRPIAFGGRAFDGQPKYLNSPKTPLFDKGRLLYGLPWSRDGMAATRTAVLVEGYTDVLTLHRAGLTNCVGSMGTALTQGQADLLKRFVDDVVISYDQDAAGGAAAIRGMQILRNSGLGVRVVRLPAGEDPDGLVRREGREAMEAAIDAAVPFHRFFVERVLAEHDPATARGKERILDEVREFYQALRVQTLREEIERQLADVLDLSIESVRRELPRRREIHWSDRGAQGSVDTWDEEEVLLALLLRGDVTWDRIAASASAEDFSEENRPIVELLASGVAEWTALVDHLDEESSRRASYYALAPIEFTHLGGVEKALKDTLARLAPIPEAEDRLHQLTERMEQAAENENWDEWNRLAEERTALKKETLRTVKRLAAKGEEGE